MRLQVYAGRFCRFRAEKLTHVMSPEILPTGPAGRAQ